MRVIILSAVAVAAASSAAAAKDSIEMIAGHDGEGDAARGCSSGIATACDMTPNSEMGK